MPDKLNFTRTNGPVDELIDQLIGFAGGVHRQEIIREMIITALKAGQEDNDKADLKLINSTLKEMRFTSKVFGPYRDIKKVTVFGSARSKPDELIYRMARDLGKKLADAGYMVITGGGPGIMQAANEGAGPDRSFGVNIRLPFEQKANPVLKGNPRNINYKYFFNRKVAFLKESDAVILFPGGFGTMDEAFETLTLIQTGKRNPMPLILLEQPGGTYWNGWTHFLEKGLFGRGLIGEADFHLFQILDAADDAVMMIDLFYKRYHSLRYVGDQLVIRLKTPLSAGSVEKIKARFSDILKPDGDLRLTEALDEERDEPEVANLPRLVVDFNRRDFGRLKSLIDAVNNG
ncbi:MAG: TIGR00730 family Rossman fold protein [Pseudomonadota bacterium]